LKTAANKRKIKINATIERMKTRQQLGNLDSELEEGVRACIKQTMVESA
jgi:hypothetical protein